MEKKEKEQEIKNLDVNFATESETYSENMDEKRNNFTTSKIKDPNAVLIKKFDLEPGEILITTIECTIKGTNTLKSYGKLYISGRYICFAATVLGLNVKEVLPFQKIKEINSKNGKILCRTKKKKFSFYDIEKVEEIEKLICELWNKDVSERSVEPIKKKSKKSKYWILYR